VSVAGSCFDGKYAAANVQKRNIERASSQIEDKNVLLALALTVQAVSDGSRCRLVDDTKNIQAGYDTSVFGCQTLGVIEVSWNTANNINTSLYKTG
jgi:hypothetical protein